MTAAAHALFVAQPSLSQHMANLEAELGVKLLDRGAYGARPTQTGELLYNYAKNILGYVQDATIAVKQNARSPAGHVSLGLLPTSWTIMKGNRLRVSVARADIDHSPHP